ncbi:MAG TPA: hypothetical protein VMB51_15695 [Solirubrobacteraceae bacterium]|nr:hypothetical protein [Solirubrobacteraceae bacterium]
MRPIALACMLAALAAVPLAGCGSSNDVASKSAAQIIAASIAAAKGAQSVRVNSETSEQAVTIGYELQFARNGAQGRFKLPGLSYDVVRVGDRVYVKGNRALYEHLGKAAAKLPAGTWIVAPASGGQLSQLAQLVDQTDEFDRIEANAASPTKGPTTTVDGQPAIELKLARKLGTTSLYVATTGKPYPIEIARQGGQAGDTTFSGWNRQASVDPPAGAVQLGQLERDSG